MLPGIARKISIPCVLVSIVGWLLFAAGFIMRNFAFKDSDQAGLEHAAEPEFFLYWIFLASSPLLYTFSILYTFWKHTLPRFFMHVFLPLYLVGVGGVLMVNGVAIYDYLTDDISKKFLVCRDALGTGNNALSVRFNVAEDIHGDANYIPVEFAGALTSVAFFYLYWLLVPCFATSKKDYN